MRPDRTRKEGREKTSRRDGSSQDLKDKEGSQCRTKQEKWRKGRKALREWTRRKEIENSRGTNGL